MDVCVCVSCVPFSLFVLNVQQQQKTPRMWHYIVSKTVAEHDFYHFSSTKHRSKANDANFPAATTINIKRKLKHIWLELHENRYTFDLAVNGLVFQFDLDWRLNRHVGSNWKFYPSIGLNGGSNGLKEKQQHTHTHLKMQSPMMESFGFCHTDSDEWCIFQH